MNKIRLAALGLMLNVAMIDAGRSFLSRDAEKGAEIPAGVQLATTDPVSVFLAWIGVKAGVCAGVGVVKGFEALCERNRNLPSPPLDLTSHGLH